MRSAHRARVGLVLAVLGALLSWTAVHLSWLSRDGRWIPGDELATIGAVEEMAVLAGSQPGSWLVEAWIGQRGEYPNPPAALLGLAWTASGFESLDSDHPQQIALLGAWLTCVALAGLGWALGGTRLAATAVLVLLSSTLFGGLARHVMYENAAMLGVVVAAAGVWRARTVMGDRPWRAGAWLGLGIAIAALSKQTTAFAVLPMLLALPWTRLWPKALTPVSRGHAVRALASAGLVASAIAGPWYVRNALQQLAYLDSSASGNEGLAGVVLQAAFYPLVIVQQAWPPLLWVVALWLLARTWPTRQTRWLWFVIAGHLLLLLLVPKKYPRLVATLLPLLSLGIAELLLQVSPARRTLLGALAAASVFSNSVAAPGPLRLLDATGWLIDRIDQRCPQTWIERPEGPDFPWDELVALVAGAAPADQEFRVGSPRWPGPLCEHRATMDLGAHLDVRLRRAGLAARADHQSWSQADQAWPEEPGRSEQLPEVLISESGFRCADWPGLCGERGPPRLLGIVKAGYADWPVAVEVWAWGERTDADWTE